MPDTLFISSLLHRMTLDEKIGQLNLLIPGGATVTGPAQSEDVELSVRVRVSNQYAERL